MIISVILDTEYMGVAERNKWFLKSVSHTMKEDVLIITHSYFRDHLREVVEGCADRFYQEFEMDRVTVEEIEKLDICYIPDEMIDSLYDKCGSRSKQLIYLFNNNVPQIQDYVVKYVDAALRKRDQTKPEFILNSLHVFQFVRILSTHYGCPIVPWVFSAIRKVHGYSQTLYMAHIDDNLFNSNACKKMFEDIESDDLGFPVLNKKEILSLFGKTHNLPLLPLIDREGKYEVGVVGEGFHITPEIYQKDNVTDDDVYYESKRFFNSSQIITRQHPMQLDQAGIGRKHMKNDPAAFILSSKRVVTVQSQMIMKAAMWNRAAVALSDALPYSFLLNSKIESAKPIDDYRLNFILFAYFVPDSCMFSTEYWKWRLQGPSIKEIIEKHIEVIFKNLGMNRNILMSKDRLYQLVKARGFSDDEVKTMIENVLISDVPYDYPTSCLKCYLNDGSTIMLFALNHKEGNSITTRISIPKDCVKIDFIPQNDLDGYVKIDTVYISDDKFLDSLPEMYASKNQTIIAIDVEDISKGVFEAKWEVRSFNA